MDLSAPTRLSAMPVPGLRRVVSLTGKPLAWYQQVLAK